MIRAMTNREKVEALRMFASIHFHAHQMEASGLVDFLQQLWEIADVLDNCFLKDLHTASDCYDYMSNTMRGQFQKEWSHYEPETRQESKRKRSRS